VDDQVIKCNFHQDIWIPVANTSYE